MLRSVGYKPISEAVNCMLILDSRERAGKLHHPFLRFVHQRRASHRRGGQEPGCHEPCQHRLRYQVSARTTPRSNEALICHDRRLIGRRYDDPTVKKDIETWPFKIVDQGGSPLVEVEYLGEKKRFSPQEISSMVLVKVRIENVSGKNSSLRCRLR